MHMRNRIRGEIGGLSPERVVKTYRSNVIAFYNKYNRTTHS